MEQKTEQSYWAIGPTIALLHQNGSSTIYENCRKLPSGGTKTIYELSTDEVIACVPHSDPLPFLQSEVNFSKHLRELGFRAQNYELAEVDLGVGSRYVLKMPSFAYLGKNGQQIRDVKNQKSSVGTTCIFETEENLLNEEHWRKLLTPLIQDISSYFIHRLDRLVGGDACSIVIEDTESTKELISKNNSKLITDRGQELHFYFFDFGNEIINPDDFKENPHLVDLETGKFSPDLASKLIDNVMKAAIFSFITSTCPLDSEYNKIDWTKPAYKEVFEKIWPEIREQAVNNISTHLDTLSDEERINQYTCKYALKARESERKFQENLEQLKKSADERQKQFEKERPRRQELWDLLEKTQQEHNEQKQAKEQEEQNKYELIRSKTVLHNINFHYHFDLIEAKKNDMKTDEPGFAAAETLCLKLTNLKNDFLNSKDPLETKKILFKETCLAAIADAKLILRPLPGWEKLLYQIASAIASILSFGVANCLTGQGFFELIQPELTHQELDNLVEGFNLLS